MADLGKIKMLVMDVDGVLTDGRIVLNSDGSESKNFSVLDGHGIRMWHRAGLKTVILPKRNEKDMIEIPAKVKRDLEFIFVEWMGEVLDVALLPAAATDKRA